MMTYMARDARRAAPREPTREPPGAATPWLELLAPVRARLSARDAWGKKGSLRWLERALAARGGRGGSVRNILYKNLGSFEEKRRLFDLLKDLYEVAELPPPTEPEALRSAGAKRPLGHDKRLHFARFLRELSAGGRPQLVVVGGAATGKSVLLEGVQGALPEGLLLNLSHDLSPALFLLAETLGVTGPYERLSAQLSPRQPFSQSAALQEELRRTLAAQLNAAGRPLLLRAEARATLGGVALRGAGGEEVPLAEWLEPLLQRLEVPYLAALSEPPSQLAFKPLRPPSRREARRFLSERLPGAPSEQIEALLNRAGLNYGELSRLALLAHSRAGAGGEAQLRRDPALQDVLQVLSALSPEADPAVPVALLEALLGRPLTALTQAEGALLEPLHEGFVKPALRALLQARAPAALHVRALEFYRNGPNRFRWLYHAKEAGAWDELVARLHEDPSQLALLPGLWAEAQGWPPEARDGLAFAVVRYRAVLGDYTHPEAKSALARLSASEDPHASAWARVKMAEACIDEGRFVEAEALIGNLPPLTGEAAAELLLVRAALARWRGAYAEAEGYVQRVLTPPIPPLLEHRARLWQGLVAKDAGRFGEALQSLSKVAYNPLLAGRARYQEGDLRARLGDPEAGAHAIAAALTLLEGTVSDEERARVLARLGTVLRRSGRFTEARAQFSAALAAAPDPFTRARVSSEAAVVESAQGRPWEALRLAAAADAFYSAHLEGATARLEEARYRARRTRYRLAVAYFVWATGDPYCPPFRGVQSGSRPTGRTEALLRELLTEVAPLAGSADRYASLHLDVACALALVLPAPQALRVLQPLQEGVPDYLKATLQLALTEAWLRAGETAEAASYLARLRTLPPDPGLRAWRAALEAELLLALGQGETAGDVVGEALTLPRAFRAQLGRVWGRCLTDRGQEVLARRWLGPNPSRTLALPEALALHFHSGAPQAQPAERAA